MPIYHFNVDDGSSVIQPEPVKLPDIKAAKSQAVIFAGEVLKDADGKFWQNRHWRIEVTDPTGLLLCALNIDGETSPAADA